MNGNIKICLSKEEICDFFSSVIKQWKKPPAGIYPCFVTETWYAECFLFYISKLTIDDGANIVPLVTTRLRAALDDAFRTICRVLEKHPTGGIKIFEIMNTQRFILMKDRKTYNRRVPGKSPKGIIQKDWEDYNHWVLANMYWQGFLWSQQPGFHIVLPHDASGPLELLMAQETKPLWGMRIKALEGGTPIIGVNGDCISVHPYASFETYFGTSQSKK